MTVFEIAAYNSLSFQLQIRYEFLIHKNGIGTKTSLLSNLMLNFLILAEQKGVKIRG